MARVRLPLCFGLISDIQYADIEPASNFSGSEHRGIERLFTLRALLYEMLALAPELSFIAQLGDLIDGQNVGEYGQGLDFNQPQSEVALEQTLQIWDEFSSDVYHVIGNHELYNFTWEELNERLNGVRGQCQHHLLRPNTYGSFSPQEGWRVIILNSYELNVIKPRDEQTRIFTEALLSRMNPNYGRPSPFNFFQGLPQDRLRYVPFNGGFGQAQLDWLSKELNQAASEDEQCLVFSHLPSFAPAASERNVAFDADELVERLGERRDQVRGYFAGHRHSGGAAIDPHEFLILRFNRLSLMAFAQHGLRLMKISFV